MALKDRRGLTVSTDSRAALDHYERAVTLFNGFYLDFLAAADAALAEDPHFVMAHCFKAGIFATCNEAATEPDLRRCLAAAEALAPRATDRERRHMAAARAWADGALERAQALYDRILVDHPHDILALQIAHQCDFFLGDSRMLRDRVARVLPHWDPTVPGYSYLLGMHAFGLEQTNLYDRAEESGRRALALEPHDPWAIHAVAHVMEMEGRAEEGVAWMTGRRAEWADDNVLAYHNWWHLALYFLDRGDAASVLSLYDAHVRPDELSMVMQLVDASAMLWRLHLAGMPVGDRWRPVADAWEARAADGYYPFNDAHAMMAFVADGRGDAERRALAALDGVAAGQGSSRAAMAREVGVPVCRAIAAFGRGDFRMAAELLLGVRSRTHRFGGSHAQRDVFDLTLVEAAIRGGDAALARALTAERRDLKPHSAANRVLTARALAAAQARTVAAE